MKNMQTSINIDQNRGTQWTNENPWKSKKFRILTKFIRAHNVNINVHKKFPRPASYKLQAAGCKLQATVYRRGATGPLGVSGYKPGATGSRLQATGCKLQATSIMFGVGGPRGSFRYVGGLQKAVISNCICCKGVACWNDFSKYVG